MTVYNISYQQKKAQTLSRDVYSVLHSLSIDDNLLIYICKVT